MPKLLHHPKDWISLVHIALVLSSLLAFYAFQANASHWFGWWWLLIPIATLSGIYTNYVAHNHSHKPISEIPVVNRILDFLLGFTSGTPLVFWRLHHVENHHRYEGTARDWSWNYNYATCKFPETPIPLWYYCVTFTPIVFCQVTLHVLRRPFSKDFQDYFISLTILTLANVILFMWSPLAWILTNAAIYLWAPFFLGFANYFHHYACPDRRGVRAANSFVHRFHNSMSYNIGFHIEHSMKPKMHWSELPAFFEAHRHEIPVQHVETEFFPGASAFTAVGKWLRDRAAQADYTGYLPQPTTYEPTAEQAE